TNTVRTEKTVTLSSFPHDRSARCSADVLCYSWGEEPFKPPTPPARQGAPEMGVRARQAPSERRLPLGVLRRLPGLLQPVLLPLLDPGVPGQEARLLQRRAVLRVDQGERPGHTEAQRPRLPGDAAAGDPGHDVELALRAERHERLVDKLLVHLVREVDVELPA